MRAYQNTVAVSKNELWPQNVQSEYTGHLPKWVIDRLSDIAGELHDHIRSWVYDSLDEACGVLQNRLDYLFEHKESSYPRELCRYIAENVTFTIVF